jgi:hypothetical protein
MKSNTNIPIILATLSFTSPVALVNCIHTPMPFMVKTQTSVRSSNLLLQIRGGQQEEAVPIVNEELHTGGVDDTTMTTEEAYINENSPEATTAATTTMDKNIITRGLRGIISGLENFGFFYMNSLSSYPYRTIGSTIAIYCILYFVTSIIFRNTTISGTEKTEDGSNTIDENKSVSTYVETSINNNNACIGKGNRGLLTGLGTAAATTFAIYQAVTRPTSSEEDEEGYTGLPMDNNNEEDQEEDEEYAETVFKGV